MKKILEGVGALLVLGGGSGIVHELTGWFHLLGFTRFLTENVGFLDDRAIFTNIVIAVVGFAVLMISDRVG
ncbi:hypothetical protein [Streptomyces sp. NPDC014894]|uniref:hypothetical protein n=1 Tax=unclassified Streptomyces TaxID=2593676 RepID=UPI0036F9FA61